MSAYDLFALHLRERETAHRDLERRRVVLERLAWERAARADVPAAADVAATSRRHVGLRRLLPGGA